MVVDKGPFCQLLQYQRPSTKDNNIPHRTKLREEVVEKAKVAIQRLTEHLAVWFTTFSCYAILILCFRPYLVKSQSCLTHGPQNHMIHIWR